MSKTSRKPLDLMTALRRSAAIADRPKPIAKVLASAKDVAAGIRRTQRLLDDQEKGSTAIVLETLRSIKAMPRKTIDDVRRSECALERLHTLDLRWNRKCWDLGDKIAAEDCRVEDRLARQMDDEYATQVRRNPKGRSKGRRGSCGR